MASLKRLLIIDHAPSENTQKILAAVIRGATHNDIEHVTVKSIKPFDAQVSDVENCDAIILGTTENLAYMSGALKDFFDRVYYPVLETKQGLTLACYIRAGEDGTGTRRAIETITTGLKWSWQQEPLILKGPWQDAFLIQAEELGMSIAAQLDLSACD